MPVVDFDPKFKKESVSDFPRLKLKKGERAKILCIEKPFYAYVHTLRAPKILNGKPVMMTKERASGETFETYDLDFIGRPLCLGDMGILEEKGSDPKNCPICARAQMSDEVSAPDRRWAMNVIKYALNARGELRDPFGCELVVWSFPDSIFNKLADFAHNFGSLHNHDLNLGPCEVEAYQKFDIQLSGSAAWQASEANKELVKKTYKNNKLGEADLEQFCGRRVNRGWMEEDLNKVSQRWAAARGETQRGIQYDDGTADAKLSSELSDLLGDEKADPGLPSMDDLFAGPSPAQGAERPQQGVSEPDDVPTKAYVDTQVSGQVREDKPADSKKESEPRRESSVVSVDDLLGDSPAEAQPVAKAEEKPPMSFDDFASMID